MLWYRVIKKTPLSSGLSKGQTFPESQYPADVLGGLIANKAVALVATPPIVELAGWSKRAAKLETIGVVSVSDLLNASDEKKAEITDLFNHKSAQTVDKWQTEVQRAIEPPAPKKGD